MPATYNVQLQPVWAILNQIEAVNPDRKEAVSEYLRQFFTVFIDRIVSEDGEHSNYRFYFHTNQKFLATQ
jgi:hypothetical protein